MYKFINNFKVDKLNVRFLALLPLMLMLFCNISFADKNDEYEKILDEIWADKDFSDDIPEKWSHESSVIVYYKKIDS